MKYATTFTIAFALLCSTGAARQPTVTFVSPCECQGFHGKNRWVAKTDLSPVPLDKSAIQAVIPSQIYAWEGLAPDVDLTRYAEARMPSEQKWCALTGRVVDAKVEADGDIHIALQDPNGGGMGTVSAEIPVGPKTLLAVKDAWRNPSMHEVGQKYTDEEASDIYRAARRFMEQLSTKLKE